MNYDTLKKEWLETENIEFKGWDFSYLTGRWETEPLPWDYRALIHQYLKKSDKLLDLGTGGGEILLSLQHPHDQTCVTESYPPNVELCRKILSPLGIEVRQNYEDNLIPYEDQSFDLVLSRHESYHPEEVRRVLKPGGIFITQQVGGQNNVSLSKRLIDNYLPPYPEVQLDLFRNDLKSIGFDILYSDEYHPVSRFHDVGAVIYLAKILEWEFPGFSVERCFDHLCRLYEDWKETGYIETREHRFILIARC